MILLHTILTQVPTGTPNPGDGTILDFSDPFEVIVYIVLPVLLVGFYFLYRRKKK